ncbi:MAG TPA: hypothetical protein VHC19_27480 [Pirellulales bacterium]|nr:hypothetical protein [Pirellulales bacterium]
MSSLKKNKHVWRSALAGLVPLALMAAVVLGSLSTSTAARPSKSSDKNKKSSADAKSQSPRKGRLRKVGEYNPEDETVEMFDAMNAGQIEVKLIPKDSTQGRVFVKNKTKRPLNVKLPEAFAAAPILAQAGGQGMGGGMGGGGMGGGGMGGGFFNVPGGGGFMNGPGMGGGFINGPGGAGGGFFNVPPEKEENFKVPCMCLEHGKAEPRASMTYKVQPIETFTDKPGVAELCRLLGYGKISQRAAQVAAWHLNNDMSWEELYAKRIKHADGSTEPYFTAEELRAGMAVASHSLTEWKNRKQQNSKEQPVSSPGEKAAQAALSNEPSESAAALKGKTAKTAPGKNAR